MPNDLGLINHIALVLDASSSMQNHSRKLIEVADAQVAHLARRSQELDQETRITIYTFADTVECIVYDKDVLRLPSLAKYYKPNGKTALIDATVQSQQDLAVTAQLYGDHAFLTFVFTDGMENRSRKNSPAELRRTLEMAPDNWTVAVMVPDRSGEEYAKQCGFFAGNIDTWDVTSSAGLIDAVARIRTATDSFMTGRAQGVRGTRNVFSTGADALNRETVKSAHLTPLKKTQYDLITVDDEAPIREFVQSRGLHYSIGDGYYQLTKREEIQSQKKIAIRNKKSGQLYVGQGARDLLGLPQMTVKVAPDHNPDFQVFVQSTSVNRKLVPGTKLLLVPSV